MIGNERGKVLQCQENDQCMHFFSGQVYKDSSGDVDCSTCMIWGECCDWAWMMMGCVGLFCTWRRIIFNCAGVSWIWDWKIYQKINLTVIRYTKKNADWVMVAIYELCKEEKVMLKWASAWRTARLPSVSVIESTVYLFPNVSQRAVGVGPEGEEVHSRVSCARRTPARLVALWPAVEHCCQLRSRTAALVCTTAVLPPVAGTLFVLRPVVGSKPVTIK